VRTFGFLVVLVMALVSRSAWADAPELDFQAPPSAIDPSTAAAMRDLAERLLPVYQNADPDRYLTNLSALQMAAGDYSSADVSRQSLRDRRRRADLHRPVGRGVIFDIYAYAKAIEAENRVTFAQGFTRAYHEVVHRLDDQDAYIVDQWFAAPPATYRGTLQKLLDQQRAKDAVGETEALQMIWAYLSFDAYRQFAPLVTALIAEEDERRYVAEAVDPIKGRGGRILSAFVVRSRSAAKAEPALLELTLDGSREHARESAARGYVGVAAQAVRRREDLHEWTPYQTEGDDARAVIDWITRQPWSDGRVGMIGDGYGGFAAWAAARQAPPALKAIATSSPTAPGVNFPMTGNISLNSAFRWSLEAVPHADPSLNAVSRDEAAWRALDQTWYTSGRRYRDLGRIYGAHNPLFLRWLNHPSYDRYWQRLMPYQRQFAAIKIPVLTTSGYYAESEPGALYYFAEHLRYDPRADHAFVIGPYDDARLSRGGVPASTGTEADAAAGVDLDDLRYKWLDHVFKGGAMPAVVKDRVNYELVGANEWRHAPSLEGVGKSARRFYLDSNPTAAFRTLSTQKPARQQFTLQTLSFLDRSDAARVPSNEITRTSPDLHNAVAYVSEPLAQAVDVAGLFSGQLDFTVNKMDMDLEISLYEQTDIGVYVRLFGPAYAFRSSYVRDRVHRHLLEDGTRQQLSFRSERFSGRRLKAGSRLVVVLGISKRPDREINYGTGNDVSEETIADGNVPLRVDWYNDSYIDVPLAQ